MRTNSRRLKFFPSSLKFLLIQETQSNLNILFFEVVTIKNVALIGAGGAVGEPVLDAILKSGKFNVIVLIRSTSKSIFPSSVKCVTVDYSDVASLERAFHGQDAVVSTVGYPGIRGQKIAIDAAIAAGVKRFIPSGYGADLGNSKTKQLPVFGDKIVINDYIEEKAAENLDFSYTHVQNGVFLDWGLEHNFLLDLKSGKPRIFDGGDQLWSTTTLKSVAQAVVGVLEHPDETKNRAVNVQDMVTSQNKLLAIAKQVAPEQTKTWEPVPTSLAVIKKASDEALARGQFSEAILIEYLYVSVIGDGYGGLIDKTDNELLGVAGDKTDTDIEAMLRPLLK